MNMTLENLFRNYPGGLCIPHIQRGYVQGRDDDKGRELRATFAPKLVKAVFGNEPLSLDFVYGVEKDGCLLPLDGQQRLTTLFLLAWLCGKWMPEWRFTYEARRIPQLFVEGLIGHPYQKGTKPSEQIEKASWFLPIWKREPNIAGMLRMLDVLHMCLEKSGNNPEDANFQNITFRLHGIDSASATFDHIFRKMNARGKALSPWENMKAMLDKYLPADLAADWRDKIDGDWAECIWSHTGSDVAKLDNAMEKVIRAVYARYTVESKHGDTLWEMEEALQSKPLTEAFYRTAAAYYAALEDIAKTWSQDRAKNALWGDVKEQDNAFWEKLSDGSKITLTDILRFAFLTEEDDDRRRRVLLNLLDASEKNITQKTIAKALKVGINFLKGVLDVEEIEKQESGYLVDQVKDEVRKWKLDEQRVKAFERASLVHRGSLRFIGWSDFKDEQDVEARLMEIHTQIQAENWKTFYRNLASRLDSEKVYGIFYVPMRENDEETWREHILTHTDFIEAIKAWHDNPTPPVEPAWVIHLFEELIGTEHVRGPAIKRWWKWFYLLNTATNRSNSSIRLDLNEWERDHRKTYLAKGYIWGTDPYQEAKDSQNLCFDVNDEAWSTNKEPQAMTRQ